MMATRLYAPASFGGVRGGTPLTLDRAIHVLGHLVEASERQGRVYDRTVAHYEAMRSPAGKARWRARAADAQAAWVRVERARDRLENEIDAYTSALVAREKEGGRGPEPPMPPPKRRRVDRQVEWQFGLNYHASRRGGHDVDLNMNIRRADGARFTAAEARAALAERIDIGAFSGAYEVAQVVYRSPRSGRASGRGFRSGGLSPDELDEAFDHVIVSTNLNDWRIGGIE